MTTMRRTHEPVARAAATDVTAELQRQLTQAPYRTLGVALGLGLLAGARMWRLLARSLVEVGARTLMSGPIFADGPHTTRHKEA